MTVYVVTWNLNKERTGYDQARRAFLTRVERYDHTADKGLESVRWISTSSSADAIDEDLRKALDANDRLFVSKMQRGGHQGWLSETTWEWINARL